MLDEGVSEASLRLLFSPFYQADAGLSRKQTGTGLGLSNVKMLVEAMTGTVTVTSEVNGPNHGSLFQCQLHLQNNIPENVDIGIGPAHLMKRPPLQRQFSRQRSYSIPEPFLTANIMLVEDNMILARFAQRALSTLGFSHVVWVDDGQKAINEAKSMRKDLILMDLHLPILDGLEATRQIRLFDQRVAIVALTANALEQDKEMCYRAGMNFFLSKPISTKDLKETIVRSLNEMIVDQVDDHQKE
ncbi:MAG: response regulator [Sphingobacteriaceae bacterium]|nr:MAG: response regulator [Sphingobacteriaceae bacterium]